MRKLKYKVGDKVVLGKLESPLPTEQKVKQKDVVEITYLCANGSKDQHYTVKAENGYIWWVADREINHKATAALTNLTAQPVANRQIIGR